MRKQSRLGSAFAVLLFAGLSGSAHFTHRHAHSAGSFELAAATFRVPVQPSVPPDAVLAALAPVAPQPPAAAPDAAAPVEAAPPPAPAPSATPPMDDADAADFARLRQCESSGNYQDDTGNGYYGAYQFSADTWHGLGYDGLPSEAPPEVQDEAARRLRDRSGWGQWPACSRRLGLQ